MTWHGWIWNSRRQRWERVCEGDSVAVCSRRVQEIATLRGVASKNTILTAGDYPRTRPPRRKESR